jgi:hypothetical protein
MGVISFIVQGPGVDLTEIVVNLTTLGKLHHFRATETSSCQLLNNLSYKDIWVNLLKISFKRLTPL